MHMTCYSQQMKSLRKISRVLLTFTQISCTSSKYLQDIQCQENSLEYFFLFSTLLTHFHASFIVKRRRRKHSQQSLCKSLHSVSNWLALTRQHTLFGDHLGHHYRPNKQTQWIRYAAKTGPSGTGGVWESGGGGGLRDAVMWHKTNHLKVSSARTN